MTDPLDLPITLRQLKDTYDAVHRERGASNLRTVLHRLEQEANAAREIVAKPELTDFIRLDFGGPQEYTYRIASQPLSRRVQVGDLVTVPPSVMSELPLVARVTKVNVGRPVAPRSKPVVAISPEDAATIEAAVGRVKSYHVQRGGGLR